MEKIKEGSVVKVISDGRIGEVMGVKRKKAMVAFRNKQMIERDIEEYDLEDIEIYHMPEFTAKLMKSYIRGEISFSKLTKGSSIFPSEMTGEYKVNPVDILSGVRVVKNASGWEKYAWVTMIIRFFREIGISYGKPPKNKISDEDIVNCAFREILAISDEMEDELTETLDGSFDRLENMLADWIDSGNQKCPESIMKMVVVDFDCTNIDKQSEDAQRMFKKFVDALCRMNSIIGFEKRAYCYYNGTKVYPQNWQKAKKDLEAAYKLSGDAAYANSLGYIYYYGRCNKGVPEYDKAFKYFSIGSAFGYYESSYKLADMFANGYGVIKNEDAAFRIYNRIYEMNYEDFVAGLFGCNFADAALRLGRCYMNGTGCEADPISACVALLQADLAIKKRMECGDFYGDDNVAIGIRKALDEARTRIRHSKAGIRSPEPEWVRVATRNGRAGRIEVKELKNSVLSFSLSVAPLNKDGKVQKMLLTCPEGDYCDLVESFSFKTINGCSYKFLDKRNRKMTDGRYEFEFTDYKFNHITYETVFYLFDKPVFSVMSDGFIYNLPKKKKTEASGKTYTVVGVSFSEGGKIYEYLSDDENIKEGDKVIVNGYDGETEVLVDYVLRQAEAELKLPAEKYKKIVRKI